MVYDAINKKVYQADQSANTAQVVRFNYDPAKETLSSPLLFQVANATAIGGGKGGGRAASLALSPDGSALFVGYIKSGDIMKVATPATVATNTGATLTKIGGTSDGKGGSGGFVMVNRTDSKNTQHSDLYIGEIGGLGMSVIPDITGTGGRPACNAVTPCSAITVTDNANQPVTFFPSGLTTDSHTRADGSSAFDSTKLFVGDAQPNLSSQVLKFDLTTKSTSVYSTSVPSYVSSFDNKTHTTYASITGLGIAPNGDLLVGDDPTATLTIIAHLQAQLWRVVAPVIAAPSVTSVAPNTGLTTGGDVVTVTGTNLNNDGTPTIKFGNVAATAVSCASATSCTGTSPAVAGAGVVDVRVANNSGQVSAISAGDVFTYTTPPSAAVTVTGIAPATGLGTGATNVTISGANLFDPANPTTVSFGANAATNVTCAADGTSCTASSPAGTGTVDVQVSVAGQTSTVVAADTFRYVQPMGTLRAYGITAPKGGVTWVPDALGGHYWSSDHSQGFCRLDPVPGTTLLAINSVICDPGFTIGSPGQATYDPTANADGTHYIYVPDNAVRSPGVWRLTFDPATATVSSPVSMAPGLLDNLKTNGTVLSTNGKDLYVGDLVDGNIRRINNISGDPRSQTVDIVGTTQPQKVAANPKGINGTMAIIGNLVFLPENNAATYIDTSLPCAAVGTTTPCPSVALNFLPTAAPVFVSGIAADTTHNMIYISSSPGGANATIYRFDTTTITAANPGGSAGVVYVTQGNVPAAGSADAVAYCSLICTRPNDLTLGGTSGFFFAMGLAVGPDNSLLISEDVSAGARVGRGHLWRVPFVA